MFIGSSEVTDTETLKTSYLLHLLLSNYTRFDEDEPIIFLTFTEMETPHLKASVGQDRCPWFSEFLYILHVNQELHNAFIKSPMTSFICA